MESFVVKTLKRIRKEAPRRLKELRNICDELIVSLSEKEKAAGVQDTNADNYFDPLRMACESRLPRLMDIALDAMHYLMEHGYLRGNKSVGEAEQSEPDENSSKQRRRILMDVVIETVSKCSDEYDDNVQLQVIKALLTAVTSVYCEVHEASLLLAVRSCFHIHLISKNQVNKTTAKAALTQMLSVVNQRMESFDARSKIELESAAVAAGVSNEDGTGEEVSVASEPEEDDGEEGAVDHDADDDGVNDTSKSGAGSQAFPSILHKDAFLIFRALCKLSMKGIHDDSGIQSSDPIALQNKILSLELILHVLQRSGPAFRSGERFIFAIRHYLCVALLSNCTSQVNQVTGLSLQIFVSLMDGFKDHLKSELEVFVTNIFLKILESENSSFDHKMRVLEVFHIICTESSAMVEVFINYDCDLEAIDLFRRIVDGFAKIAKNPSLSQSSRGATADFMASVSNASKRLATEEQNLRVKGLEGLVIVLRSLLRSANLWQGIGELGHGQPDPAIAAAASLAAVNALDSPSGDGLSEHFERVLGSAADEAGVQDEYADEADPSSAVEVFDRKQKFQEEIETGILKFNLSSKKGLAYLVSLGHLEMNPSSVAEFLMTYQDRLDKTAVGDYLGREPEYENGFCVKVLHKYVDAIDFSGLAFDMAIRRYLAGFRLPGEAQKIDRLMEKFAERYYLQNRDTFASADMAFILAFSTIMLQTNLHNPAIRDDKRMTKEQFIKQNKGISSDGELPDSMLIEIYDRIAAEPISISQNDKFKSRTKKEDQAAFTVFPLSTDKRRKDAFNNERKEMVKAGEAMFKQKLQRAGRASTYVRTKMNTRSDDACSRPMFDIVWAPMVGVLSQLLETYDDAPIVDLCLTCFQYAARLACRLDFPVARNTLINALAKFTALDSVREMQSKSVDSIKTLLDIALYEGDYLEESWGQVLQCISQLARLQLFANGLHSDDIFFSDTSSVSSTDSAMTGRTARSIKGGDKSNGVSSLSLAIGVNVDQFAKLFSGPSRAETIRQVEECNAELVAREIDPDSIVRIYVNSQTLSEDSVYHFVRGLREVSSLEISASSSMTSLRGKDTSGDAFTPRVFSLQKLVEVADFNMGSRPRLAWANIWSILAEHFTSVGVHDNHALAMFAIDSLKQLSIKFLQKEELSNFNFQRLFLKPFEVIILRSKSPEIKDLVLRCIDIMIRACANNIRSGWKSIFAIFEVAANQDMLEIANIAFDITERLMTQQFELLIFDFVELMNCLVAFVGSPHSTLSLKALSHLSKCADHLANGTISPALDAQLGILDTKAAISTAVTDSVKEAQIDEDASVFRLWWPLLLGLSGRVGDSRPTVRVKALATLSIVLRNYGHLFSPQTWRVIFKGVLFPMIDSAKTDSTVQPESSWPGETPSTSMNGHSWISSMALSVFSVCLELFQMFKEKAGNALLLPDLTTMIEGCICQDTETLSRMALKVYGDLIVGLTRTSNGDRIGLDTYTADLACNRFSGCLLRNLCLDFGEIGFLEIAEDAPSAVADLIPECPLALRRLVKDGGGREPISATPQTAEPVLDGPFDIKTPYADGRYEQVIPQDAALDVGARRLVRLSWGAKLYTFEDFPPSSSAVLIPPSERALMMPRLTEEQEWRELSSAVMTSMVISLDFIKNIRIVVQAHFGSWRLEHFSTFLSAVEASHWHAKSFNANHTIRSRLRKRGFMPFAESPIKLPHLLEQEVDSASLLLDTSLHMYALVNLDGDDDIAFNSGIPDQRRDSDGGEDLEAFAEPWVQRIGSLVLRCFISLEVELQSTSAAAVSAAFAKQHHATYIPCVVAALRGIGNFSPAQFGRNKSWLIPLLSQLILCEDKQIRLCVSKIYSIHVNPLLLS